MFASILFLHYNTVHMFENKKVQGALGVLLAVILLAGGGWYVFNDIQREERVQETENEEVAAKDDPGYTINFEKIPTTPAPELYRAVTVPDNFPADAEVIVRQNIETLRNEIEENPDLFQSWINLASQYKIIQDYEGAIEIWEYLNETAPQNTLSRVNLGGVYHYELQEYEKAEENFREALSIEASTPQAYLGLHELYLYSYKINTTLAEDVLKEGIAALPDNIDLVTTLASYYKNNDQVEEAIGAYEDARELAEELDNQGLVNAINTEIEKLKQ